MRYECSHTCAVFQFHKGTIKTYMEYKTAVDKVQFQFHKGTIKTATTEQAPTGDI